MNNHAVWWGRWWWRRTYVRIFFVFNVLWELLQRAWMYSNIWHKRYVYDCLVMQIQGKCHPFSRCNGWLQLWLWHCGLYACLTRHWAVLNPQKRQDYFFWPIHLWCRPDLLKIVWEGKVMTQGTVHPTTYVTMKNIWRLCLSNETMLKS